MTRFIIVENGVPRSEAPAVKMGAVLDRLNIGQSFVVGSRREQVSWLTHCRGRITTEKVNGKGFRIWKVK